MRCTRDMICVAILCIVLTIHSSYGRYTDLLPSRRRVCYEEWGCFSSSFPFINSVGFLPQDPQEVNVRFYLFTRSASPTQLNVSWPHHHLQSLLDVQPKTGVILHGYLDHSQAAWVHNLVSKLLYREDMNVIVVDWKDGARNVNYLQVVANTRLVAKVTAVLLQKLVQIGADKTRFHLIGHSLGAHIAGYVGEEIPGIGRITGLDPAGPAFEGTTSRVRLDPTDAIFVDVIHTNAVPITDLGFGYRQPCGTVDFYPNGGRNQPGCHTNLYDRLAALLMGTAAVDVFSCDHLRALYLFIESVTSDCTFQAQRCSNHRALNSYECQSCDDVTGDCVAMGYDVEQDASGIFYVETGSSSPYCLA